MSAAVAACRPRCLAVAAGGTAALWGAAAVLVRSLAVQPAAATPDAALVRLCTAALVLALVWAWLQVVTGVADAWRGGVGRRPGGAVRRLAVAACGVALAGALAAPARAGGDPDPLAGLPLPERAEGAAQPREERVVVRAGDCLWALAARDLSPRATDREITARWHQIYAANRGVIGPQPNLIHPGQVLRLTKESS